MKAVAEHSVEWWAAALRRIGHEYHGNFFVYQFAAIQTGAKRSKQQSYPWLSLTAVFVVMLFLNAIS
jgi:hypothetical protein